MRKLTAAQSTRPRLALLELIWADARSILFDDDTGPSRRLVAA